MKKILHNSRTKSGQKGFTLLEILLVVAAIGILSGIVIVAVNPNKQLGVTRNAQRQADVNTILNAVYQYSVDNDGAMPSTVTTTSTEICATGMSSSSCTSAALVNLSVLSLDEKYLLSLPLEPQKTNATGTGYMIKKSANGRVTVEAQFEEQDAIITVTR